MSEFEPNNIPAEEKAFEFTAIERDEGYSRFDIYDIDDPSLEREIFLPDGSRAMGFLTPIDSYELSEFDTSAIEKGTKRLVSYLSSSKELPTALIFPDTSARPLYWAVRDGVKKEYEKRGLDSPKIVFLKSTAHFIASANKDEISNELDSFRAKKDAELLVAQINRLEQAKILNENSNIMVIDDYLHKGGAYKYLGAAIKSCLRPGNFLWFTFLASPNAEEEEDMIIASHDTRRTPGLARSGFDYAATALLRSNVTGVDKESSAQHIDPNRMADEVYYSRRLKGSEINRDIATKVRKQLSELGERAAADQ